jgi:hypothetical protein
MMLPLPRGDRLPMDNLQSSLVAGNTRKTCPCPLPFPRVCVVMLN